MRSLTVAGLLGGAAVASAMLPSLATAAPLYEPPARTEAGVSGPWQPGFPVRNLDRSGGLDLAVIGCQNNESPRPPAAPNLVACPAPQPTMSILLGDGAGNLRIAQLIHAGSYPTDVTSAQLNNDGRLDLAVTDPFGTQSTQPGEVRIYEQLAAPELGDLFRLRKTITLAGPQPKGLQSADLNRDGAEDLVVLESNPNGPDIQVLLGDREGNFNFAPQPAFGSCTSAHFFKGFSDFNEDGRLDFVVPCVGDAKLAVMLGNGDGTFTENYIPYPGVSMNVAQADLNKDGHADVAFSTRRGGIGQLVVFLGDGKGNLLPTVDSPYSLGYTSGNQFTTFVDIADFGGPAGAGPDGVLDVAVSNSAVNFATSSVSFLYGRGDGGMVSPAPEGSPFDLGAGTSFLTWGLVAGDFNSDGRPDLVTAGGAPASTSGKLTLFMSRAPAVPGPVPPTGGEVPGTGPVATGPVAAAPVVTRDTLAPGISNYSLTNRAFVAGTKRTTRYPAGTSFRYTLSEAATARLVLAQRRPGRRSGRRCVAPTRRLRSAAGCTRVVVRGRLTRNARQGANRIAFSGRIGARTLAPGRYEARLTATDAAGNSSRPKTIRFTIARR